MRNIRTAVAIGVVILAALAAIGSGDNKAEKVGSSGGAPAATTPGGAPAPSEFKVGDQIKLGDDTIVVNTVTDPFMSSNEFDKPAAGTRYVAIDTSVTNNGSSPETVSSIACFTLADATGQAYSPAFVTGAPKAPDGEVAPGKVIRGTLVYAVPTTVPTGLALTFKCDLFSTGSATVQLD